MSVCECVCVCVCVCVHVCVQAGVCVQDFFTSVHSQTYLKIIIHKLVATSHAQMRTRKSPAQFAILRAPGLKPMLLSQFEDTTQVPLRVPITTDNYSYQHYC